MKKVSSILIFMIYLSKVFAFSIELDSKTPTELKKVLEDISSLKLTNVQKDSVLKSLKIIDNMYEFTPKEHWVFIIKSEILKSILEQGPKETLNPDLITNDFLNDLKNKSYLSKTINWLKDGFVTDLKNLLNEPDYKNVLKNSPSYKRIRHKINLATPWIKIFLEYEEEKILEFINPIIVKSLEDTAIALEAFSNLRGITTPKRKIKSMKLFKIFDTQEKDVQSKSMTSELEDMKTRSSLNSKKAVDAIDINSTPENTSEFDLWTPKKESFNPREKNQNPAPTWTPKISDDKTIFIPAKK